MTVSTAKFTMGFNSLFEISLMFLAVWSYWTSHADATCISHSETSNSRILCETRAAVRRNLGNENYVGSRKNTSFTNNIAEDFLVRRVPQLKRKRRSMRSLTWSFYTHINHQFHYQVLKWSDYFYWDTGSDGFIFSRLQKSQLRHKSVTKCHEVASNLSEKYEPAIDFLEKSKTLSEICLKN